MKAIASTAHRTPLSSSRLRFARCSASACRRPLAGRTPSTATRAARTRGGKADCIEDTDPAAGDWHTSCTGLAACPDAGQRRPWSSIHGGRIERSTSEISAELAGIDGGNLYDFNAHLIEDGACRGLETDGSPSNDNFEVLHITATHFDHAEALAVVGAHPDAVSIHGCSAKACSTRRSASAAATRNRSPSSTPTSVSTAVCYRAR